MSYYMTLGDLMFEIKKENIEKALQAIKNQAKTFEQKNLCADIDILLNAKTLNEALAEFSYGVSEHNIDSVTGDIVSLEYFGEKLEDDEMLFAWIAPYVEPDSFIQMRGEDGDIWRWVFENKELYEVTGEIVFNETTKLKIC